MRMGQASGIIRLFARNWERRRDIELAFDGDDSVALDGHPLEGEIAALCSGGAASLPFITEAGKVKWCTIAPSLAELRRSIADLQAWIIPSYGWVGDGDGFTNSPNPSSDLATRLLQISPDGYFRWTCSATHFESVCRKLTQRRHLEASRPPRARRFRPSLYELRSRFSSALLLGDRESAAGAIEQIDFHQLDSAANTQFMRIRLWHHFREFARIANHPSLGRLQTQLLPRNVAAWIEEALDELRPTPPPSAPPSPPASAAPDTALAIASWDQWLESLSTSDDSTAQRFLTEREGTLTPDALSAPQIAALVSHLETLFLDDALFKARRDIISQGVSELLQDFVREPDFPRARLGDLYLGLLRLWSGLHAGTSAGREESHVLLELASAALRLNREPAEVLRLLQSWWEARKVPAQLPFLLDAIELLDREHPDRQAATNLWIEAADFVRRAPELLTPSEKALWRTVGTQLGMAASTIAEYLPPDDVAETRDLLKDANLRSVAIVCMRERQATDAASVIASRTGAQVSLVTGKSAGEDTNRALNADVVLFVWMATTHATFRAFDRFDRNRFCYVQGTGSGSIVRALERWVLQNDS